MVAGNMHSDGIIRVGDLANRPGLTIEPTRDFQSSDDALFAGNFWHRELRPGLFVHASDVLEDAGFTASSALHAGLSCVFFLDGEVEVAMGDRTFAFHGTGRLDHGLLVTSTRDESFRRSTPGRQRIRHLVVSVTPEWLDRDGLAAVEDQRLASNLTGDHLTSRRWATSQRLAELVSRILAADRQSSPILNLLIESAAVEIVAEALAAGSHQDVRAPLNRLSPADQRRLQRAIDYVRAAGESWPSVDAIAREAGVSSSGLQRLFHAGLGTTVLDHVRGLRLDLARDRLADGSSVQEAAGVAGYSSAANFATAYKRRFGRKPSER